MSLRNGQNRTGGVSTDSRQREHVLKGRWKLSAMLGNDLLGGRMQRAGATIVTEALPMRQQVLWIGLGERLHVWKRLRGNAGSSR